MWLARVGRARSILVSWGGLEAGELAERMVAALEEEIVTKFVKRIPSELGDLPIKSARER